MKNKKRMRMVNNRRRSRRRRWRQGRPEGQEEKSQGGWTREQGMTKMKCELKLLWICVYIQVWRDFISNKCCTIQWNTEGRNGGMKMKNIHSRWCEVWETVAFHVWNQFAVTFAFTNVCFLYVTAGGKVEPGIKDMCSHTQSKFPDVCTSKATGAYTFINLCYN
jgi:hypothetical protein